MTHSLLPPLSLYVHMPWCVRKCPYCDFNSHRLREDLPEEQYIQALQKDLTFDLPYVQNRPLSSIFFGGGTPSLFSPAAIAALIETFKAKLSFSPDIEITLEANPGTVDESRFSGFYQAGVNRLSIGIQSFQSKYLTSLGRIHDGHTARTAIENAVAANFSNFNLDLMHGLPEQTTQDALLDLEIALSYHPPHLSWYQLTLEPNTLFHKQPPELPTENVLEEIQQAGHQCLIDSNYVHYEVSAYAQAGRQARHNLNYWEFGDYLGIGAGAHSKLTTAQSIIRMSKLRHPKDYLAADRSFIDETRTLQVSDLIFEFMLNALRLNQNISFELFERHTGLDRVLLNPYLQTATAHHLITTTKMGLNVTSMGKRYLNDLTAMFLKPTN